MNATKTNNPALSPTQLASIEHEARTAGVLRQYKALLRKGESPRMALLLAMQKFPGLKGTDSIFCKLEHERVKEIGDEEMTKIVKIAKQAGINTHGKTYNGQLGGYTDPMAWISDTHDVRVSAKEKGLSIRGQVNVENAPKPRPKKKLSERLIRETTQSYLEKDPALKERVKKSPKAKRELRERIVATHSNKLAK